ncbi:MAG: hypothetical protein K0S09_2134 [Sphingobacteriaceae bacterium]|jgi:metal-responsive CopG/Arc/MetJ family transcriptional regulator|nr:hypothetical protein [Sphingobacteriaceae bacterium]
MKSILLKLDDELFAKAEVTAKESKISRNGFIKNAIETYINILNRKKVERQLAYESMLVRDESLRINEEISNAYTSDFDDDY